MSTFRDRDGGVVSRGDSPLGRRRGSPHFVWCGYSAFVVGLLYALVSVYWVTGGGAGLDTLGGWIEEHARARDPRLIAVGWLAAGLKLVGALLGLAVVQPWGRRLPRWLLLTGAWGAATVLTLYGGVYVIAQALVQIGVIDAPANVDWKALHWHLFLWDPWFLVWGLLLGAATWGFSRHRPPPTGPGSRSAPAHP